jgi:hypothetical protein
VAAESQKTATPIVSWDPHRSRNRGGLATSPVPAAVVYTPRPGLLGVWKDLAGILIIFLDATHIMHAWLLLTREKLQPCEAPGTPTFPRRFP